MYIRQARIEDAEQIAKVHVESWRTTYKGVIKEEVLAGLSVEQRKINWQRQLSPQNDQSMVYVAETNDKDIVGFVSGGPSRSESLPFDGELYAIYILDRFQRQGIGLLLLQSFVRFLQDQGHSSMFLWALEDNRYKAFYEKCGGMSCGEEHIQIGGDHFKEVAYGWNNLNRLNGLTQT
ncbi:GNAT family N-acetyltransferase [Neobacillus mesonae]|nr:GNAT family N-acetyltransferase [Neobacillus mesonae]